MRHQLSFVWVSREPNEPMQLFDLIAPTCYYAALATLR